MRLDERIDIAVRLGELLLEDTPERSSALNKAKYDNVWFDVKNSLSAIHAISAYFLKEDLLEAWVSAYHFREHATKTIGLILAGNLPLVGFHDVLTVFISGHRAKLKLSQKDTALWHYVLDILYAIDDRMSGYVSVEERLTNIDAVIATGSDNSSRYFEYYFGKYPHIIRKNRVGVAVMYGDETEDELLAIGKDVFQYYGLGCRNVSSIFVPQNYDFILLLKLWESFAWLRDNHAYGNNYDYNYAIYLMNQTRFLANGAVVLLESNDLVSRLACLHYRFYSNHTEVNQVLLDSKDKIQTIVSTRPVAGFEVIAPGGAQCPGLLDYADGIDTMKFLMSL